MEKKVNRYYVLLAVSSFMGYFIGTTIFVLLGGQNNLYQSISGLFGSVMLASVYSIYYHKMTPGLDHKADELAKDERTLLVKGKSASMTLNFINLLLIMGIVIGFILNNSWIRYATAVVYIMMNGINFLFFKYFDKRM